MHVMYQKSPHVGPQRLCIVIATKRSKFTPATVAAPQTRVTLYAPLPDHTLGRTCCGPIDRSPEAGRQQSLRCVYRLIAPAALLQDVLCACTVHSACLLVAHPPCQARLDLAWHWSPRKGDHGGRHAGPLGVAVGVHACCHQITTMLSPRGPARRSMRSSSITSLRTGSDCAGRSCRSL